MLEPRRRERPQWQGQSQGQRQRRQSCPCLGSSSIVCRNGRPVFSATGSNAHVGRQVENGADATESDGANQSLFGTPIHTYNYSDFDIFSLAEEPSLTGNFSADVLFDSATDIFETLEPPAPPTPPTPAILRLPAELRLMIAKHVLVVDEHIYPYREALLTDREVRFASDIDLASVLHICSNCRNSTQHSSHGQRRTLGRWNLFQSSSWLDELQARESDVVLRNFVHLPCFLNILLVCRSFYNDFRTIFYDQNTFHFVHPRDTGQGLSMFSPNPPVCNSLKSVWLTISPNGRCNVNRLIDSLSGLKIRQLKFFAVSVPQFNVRSKWNDLNTWGRLVISLSTMQDFPNAAELVWLSYDLEALTEHYKTTNAVLPVSRSEGYFYKGGVLVPDDEVDSSMLARIEWQR